MSPDLDLVIRGTCVTPEAVAPASVGVLGGSVVAVEPYDALVDAARRVDLADDEVLIPGLVDTHVHVNEPGRTEWEGFASATKAAAAGGITTIVDMPLNSIPPTVDLPALGVKRAATEGQRYVDVGFWGGAVPGNTHALRGMHDAGVFGFKCFLVGSGVDEFPPLSHDELDLVAREIAGFDGLLVVHAEDAATIDTAPTTHGPRYADFLRSRPPEAEDVAIAHVVSLAAEHGLRVHVLHLSSASAIGQLSEARAQGVRITAETCPHYLVLAAEDVPDGRTEFKCCPPVREAANRELLWAALADQSITSVGSDHSPSTPDLKLLDTGDFGRAWGGISSLQLAFALTWTEARRRGHRLADVVRWMAEHPATVAEIPRKGRIGVGFDADFAVVAPEQTFVVESGMLHHRNPLTPYDGRQLHGVVRQTWLRGQQVVGTPNDFEQATGLLLGRAVG